MRGSEVRNWLGRYFLALLGSLSGYILLFQETPLLPLSKNEATCALQIIMPVLLAQVTLSFRWFATRRGRRNDAEIGVPRWVVIGPPLLVVALLVSSIVLLIAGNAGEGSHWAPAPSTFRSVVTLCVSILNASTVFVVGAIFRADR